MKAAILGCVLLLLTAHPAVGDRRLSRINVSVTPRACMELCDVRVTVTIPPDPTNRWYVLQIDGTMFHGTMKQLDETSPTQFVEWFKELPAGEYEVVAVVYDTQREVARAYDRVTVAGS